MPLLLPLLFAAALSAAEPSDSASTTTMKVHVLRLRPGADLLKSITDYVQRNKISAGIILTTVGSLTETRLRFANQPNATAKTGKVEIVSLVGTVEAGGGHLHLSVSDGNGVTTGGHLMEGCKVYTTAEIAIGELPGLRFLRQHDPASGYPELQIAK
ncbi:MAG: PPC domain-containing DNA-binding protein [Bryobacteraceae bacterium]